MQEPIKLSMKIAVEVTVFALIVGVLAVYIMLSRDYVIMNANETSRMVTMRESKAMLEYSMLEYVTKDDIIIFVSKFRDEVDIDITQGGRRYRLEKYKGGDKWDITEVRDFLETSNVTKYKIDLEREKGDLTKVVKADITVIE